MLEESLVVSSAISAFNNAALVAPAFLWNAVLCIPLFVLCFWFGRHAASRLGVLPYITVQRGTFWVVLLTALWCVLMGGNYSALRDGTTMLPWVLSVVLFLSMFCVGVATRAVKLPLWYGAEDASRLYKWFINLLLCGVILVPIATSDLSNLWVGGVQILALCLGGMLGRFVRYQPNGVFYSLMIMLIVTVAVLMQPEFFRFGQLGNLTPMHLLWILGTGVILAIAAALNIACPRGRIHNSAFVKLKWLLRLMVGLCSVLFLLTESVPMLLGTVVLMFIVASMSVWHAKQQVANMCDRLLAIAFVMFGVLIGVPTISCIGLLLMGANKGAYKAEAWFVL